MPPHFIRLINSNAFVPLHYRDQSPAVKRVSAACQGVAEAIPLRKAAGPHPQGWPGDGPRASRPSGSR